MYRSHRHDGARCWEVRTGEGGGRGFTRSVLIKPSALPFSDLQGIRTYAKRDGSDWILNGSKVSGVVGDEKHVCSFSPASVC